MNRGNRFALFGTIALLTAGCGGGSDSGEAGGPNLPDGTSSFSVSMDQVVAADAQHGEPVALEIVDRVSAEITIE